MVQTHSYTVVDTDWTVVDDDAALPGSAGASPATAVDAPPAQSVMRARRPRSQPLL